MKEELIKEMASDMNFACVKHELYPDDAKEIAKTLILLGYGKVDKVRNETAREILTYLIDSGVINTAPQTIKMYFKENYGDLL